ncbi:hypothetical protein [Nostoc sp. NMS1]|uniref:hypothetical protein n=1 Tax=Nostoc sp. NMS1 TaxID=2815388 RepID=UPI0025F14DD4|nr:hypothetical protein [Nostoc sp. NMS1]
MDWAIGKLTTISQIVELFGSPVHPSRFQLKFSLFAGCVANPIESDGTLRILQIGD